jgi:hypothetical protein
MPRRTDHDARAGGSPGGIAVPVTARLRINVAISMDPGSE